MNIQTPTPALRIDTTLTAASVAAGGRRDMTTKHLLKALSMHEGDSDLGQLADAILRSGPFSARRFSDDYDAAEEAAGDVESIAERLAETYRHNAECMV